METELTEAIAILDAFVLSFPETEALVTQTLFSITKEDSLHNVQKRKPVRWSKARNLQLVDGLEWQQVDRSLDTMLIWLCKECKKPKEKQDKQLLKERGRTAYLAFSIMGNANYSPIRTFQYGLAHFLAKIRATGTKREREVCKKMSCGEVYWANSHILYPYANKRSNFMKQLQVMKKALQMAEEQNQQELVEKIKKTLATIYKLKFPKSSSN